MTTLTYRPDNTFEMKHNTASRIVRASSLSSLAEEDGEIRHVVEKAKRSPGIAIPVASRYRKPRYAVQYAVAM